MTSSKEQCKHDWHEDPDFASGMIVMVSGSPQDLGEETRIICRKCGETDYVRIKDLGSILNIYKGTK